MNDYDLAAFDVINDYYHDHDTYPPYVEATPIYLSAMSQTQFDYQTSGPIAHVPVVPVGTGDMVCRHFIIRQLGNTFEEAEEACEKLLQPLRAKLEQVSAILLEPKHRWGVHLPNPKYCFHQVEVWAFGEQAAFD